MSLLLYKSEEMYSSTELIRKSKTIFNKILDDEIEKAIILRDGKPSFLLMEFAKYEKIMAEFEELKEYVNSLEDNTPISKVKTKRKKKQKKEHEVSNTKLKQHLEEEAKVLSMDGGDYSDIKTQKNQEEPQEESQIETTKEIESNETQTKSTTQEREELSESEEIQKAYESIETMNFDEEMKQQAKEKVRAKIIQARKEREEIQLNREQDLQKEQEMEEHLKEEKLKKEQELEEFWD